MSSETPPNLVFTVKCDLACVLPRVQKEPPTEYLVLQQQKWEQKWTNLQKERKKEKSKPCRKYALNLNL